MPLQPAKVWEGTFPISGLRLDACPWCRRPSERYYVLAFERDGFAEFEVLCERCSVASEDFASMRRNGLSRKQALTDFGYRGPSASHSDGAT